MDTIRSDSASCRYIAEHLGDAFFTVIDIGCAFGIAKAWRAFGARLRAVGFDADASEVDRLTAAETNPHVKYVAGLVGLPPGDPGHAQLRARTFWHRNPTRTLSFHRALVERGGHEYRELERRPSEEATTPPASDSDDRAAGIVLEDYFQANELDDIDFIKIDVDGPDYLILRTIERTLSRPSTLGVTIEVNFFGSDDAEINTFHNTDRALKGLGFELFNMSFRRYSSAALPWPFVQANPSITVMGRPYQGDAFYMKDVASPTRPANYDELSPPKLAKAAGLLALHGLYDQAAQVAVVHRQALGTLMDVDRLLDLLALEIQGDAPKFPSYAEYIEAFRREDSYFYARGGHPAPWRPASA
jgi:FkbM family methyltransferase